MKITFTTIVLSFYLSATCALGYESKIHVVKGKYGDYYHILFTLNPDNCVLTVPVDKRTPKYSDSNEYTFSEGGQFEVFVKKSLFPISSPKTECDYLILRMPWTDPSNQNSKKFIDQKRHIFKLIKEMKIQGKGKIDVVIELNPYVKTIKKQPLTLELTSCNIYFRHAHGQYIDYFGNITN